MDTGSAVFKTAEGPSVDARTNSLRCADVHRVGSLTANDSQVDCRGYFEWVSRGTVPMTVFSTVFHMCAGGYIGGRV